MVKICGDSQAEIAKDIAEYEMDVERDVISPFHSIIEVNSQADYIQYNIRCYQYLISCLLLYMYAYYVITE